VLETTDLRTALAMPRPRFKLRAGAKCAGLIIMKNSKFDTSEHDAPTIDEQSHSGPGYKS